MRIYTMYSHKIIIQIGSHVGNTDNDPIFNQVDKSTKMILVEPVPYLFIQLQQNYMKKFGDNSNIIFINMAVSNYVGEIELTIPSERNDFSNLPYWATQLASVNSTHATDHIANLLTDKITVKTTTINEIIKDCNITTIDLLHTDTEGHDYEILMDYDFIIKPAKIMFEHKHMDGFLKRGARFDILINKLHSLGYRIVYTCVDDTVMEL